MPADVKNSDSRWPDPHTDWEFPYGHIVWRGQDGSFMGFYEKNGQNCIFLQHGVSGTYIEINGSGDMVTATKGHKADYNMSGRSETTDGTVDVKESVRRHQIAGGKYEVVGGGSDSLVMGPTNAIHADTHNTASMKDAYHGVQGSNKLNVTKNNVITVEQGNEVKTVKSGTKTTTVKGDITVTSEGGTQTLQAPTIKIKAPSIIIEGNITMTGNFNQSGIHVDSIGPHDA